MPAEELSALENECLKLPAAVEEVPNNVDDPRPNREIPLDSSIPSIILQTRDNIGASEQDLYVNNDTLVSLDN